MRIKYLKDLKENSETRLAYTTPIFKLLNILTLRNLNVYISQIFMHKYTSGILYITLEYYVYI